MFDPSKLGDLGIGVVALFLFYLIFRLLMSSHKAALELQVKQQDATNAVVQDNTKAINKLSNTLEKSNVLEEDFRKRVLEVAEDTRDMVQEIHNKVV